MASKALVIRFVACGGPAIASGRSLAPELSDGVRKHRSMTMSSAGTPTSTVSSRRTGRSVPVSVLFSWVTSSGEPFFPESWVSEVEDGVCS